MKKILKLIMLMVFLIPLTVKADMGAPYIKEYIAIINEVYGADYYDYDYENNKMITKGSLEFNEEIKIDYEEKLNNEYYGHFNLNDKERYMIKLSDIIIKETDVKLDNNYKCAKEKIEGEYRNCYETDENLVISDGGIKLHSGPAYGYEVLSEIPKGTILKYEYASEASAWYYVEYNGIKGWVCELNGAIGTKVENLMTARELEIFEESKYSEDASIIGLIPVSTKIKEAYHLDEWSGKTLVTYNGITGYIYTGSLASYVGEKTIELNYDVDLWENLDYFNDRVELDKVTKGTKITYDYEYWDMPATYAYTTYNGKTGWLCIEYCEYLVEDPNEIETTTELITEPVTSPTVEVVETKSLSGSTIVILCVAGAIIVALTATITIILVNKKKKQNKVEPTVIKEVEVTPISNEEVAEPKEETKKE